MIRRFAVYTISTIAFIAFMAGLRWLMYSNGQAFAVGVAVGAMGMLGIVTLYEWVSGTQLGDRIPEPQAEANLYPESQYVQPSEPPKLLPPASQRNS